MADVVQVRLLGEFRVSTGARSVAPGAWRLRKARTLVKLLALAPGHGLHRDQVTDALWPGVQPDAARNNLHQVVHAARRALSTLEVDGSAVLVLHDDLLVLGADVVTDVEELRSAVAEALTAGRYDDAAAVLRDAPADLLPEDTYEPWLRGPAASFREWRAQQVMDVVRQQLADGAAETSVVLLTPVLAADPLHEPASRAMMRALAVTGRRSEALLVYERLRAVLREELAAEPEPETRQVFRELLTAAPAADEVPVVPTPRAAGHLPAPVTELIGRDRELVETAAALGRTRLLTLTGMGGSGKTTLAVELARRRAADYPAGAYLVELAAVSDGQQVAAQIAQTLRLELPPDAPPVESMVAQLGDRRALLVLDNCEHLLDSCARVASELLRGCPGLTILATSREPLRIEGEVSWRTPSLQLPDPDGRAVAEELADIASVALFAQRASAALPAFTLNDDNAGAVAEICHRLDGIPLALELAAACIPMLSPRQIADRLGDALQLLRRGDRATITRQQTLAATLAWSHDLLDDTERVLFRRLAVFAGSFSLDAVASVGGDGIDPAALLAALSRLVDTSLVVAEPRGDVVRYRLLETVRQYAVEQLRAVGEQAELQRRHCDWYRRLVQERDPTQLTVAADLVPSSLEVEHDNVRLALSWAFQHEPVAALELVVGMWRYWLARGFFSEGRRWLETVLAVSPEPTWLRAEALVALAVFDVRRGRGERLVELGAEAVAIHRTLGRPRGLAQMLQADAVLAYMRGDWDDCRTLAHEARAVAAAGGVGQVVAAADYLQAVLLMSRGRLPEARAAFDQVRASLDALTEPVPPFLPPLLPGFAIDGAPAGSPRLYFEETVLPGRLVGAEQAVAYLLCSLADVARFEGDLLSGLDLLCEARSRFVALGDRDGESLATNRLGCLHRVRGEFSEGREALEHSLRLRRAVGDRRSVGLTLSNLGVLTAAEGDVASGLGMVEQARAGFREIQDVAGHTGLSLTLASISADAGDFEAAERLLAAAMPQSERIPGNHRVTPWGYTMLGDVLTRLGRADDADAAWQRGHVLFAALGAVDGTAGRRTTSAGGVQPLQSRR